MAPPNCLEPPPPERCSSPMPTRLRTRTLWSLADPGARRLLALRLFLATTGSLAGAVAMRSWPGSSLPAGLWIPAILLVLAGLLAHHAELGSQLLARSVWWANLVLGTLISIAGSSNETRIGLVLCLGAGTALFAMGRLGLGEDDQQHSSTAFQPIAFRTTLTFSMVMAVADAQALALFSSIRLEDALRSSWDRSAAWQQSIVLAASAALICLAIVGLYRLRVWGLFLGALAAALVATLAATDFYGIKGPVSTALILTSVVQLLLPIPILVAIVRRRAPAPRPRLERAGRVALAALVLAMMAFSVVTVAVRPAWFFD